MVAHAFNPSTRGRGRWISEFEASLVYHWDSQGYTEKPCLKKKKKKTKTKTKTKKEKDQKCTAIFGLHKRFEISLRYMIPYCLKKKQNYGLVKWLYG